MERAFGTEDKRKKGENRVRVRRQRKEEGGGRTIWGVGEEGGTR